MNKNAATLEIIAPTVEEAIEKGLNDLGLSRDEIEVEILDEGSKGLFGLRARQARVRLIVKETSPSLSEKVSNDSSDELPRSAAYQSDDTASTDTKPVDSDQEADDLLDIAKGTVNDLLQKMKVHAQVTAEYGEADDQTGIKPVLINIHGNDLSILIGKNAETLNALQYIVRLIVSKELGKSVYLVVDVEGYRTRREQQLNKIAKRMAEQVITTGRSLALEPMPPNERRIIHIALRDNPDVYTESTGEGQHRKIVIYPKKN